MARAGPACGRRPGDPDWYSGHLAALAVPFRVLGSAELQRATAALGQRLLDVGGIPASPQTIRNM
jgi:hypothetical protein